MASVPLTPRPLVAALVRAAALLVAAGPACGDDEGTSSNTTDVHPTAGPCAHDPMAPECETTSGASVTSTSTTAGSSESSSDSGSTGEAGESATGTGSGTGTDTGVDSSTGSTG